MVNFTRIGTENVDPRSNPWLATLGHKLCDQGPDSQKTWNIKSDSVHKALIYSKV